MTLAKICATAIELDEKKTPGKLLCATKPEHTAEIYFIYPDDGSSYIPALEIATFYKSGNDHAEQDARFYVHAANNHALLARACLKMREALKRECFCPKAVNGELLLCHACEALAEVDALFEKGE